MCWAGGLSTTGGEGRRQGRLYIAARLRAAGDGQGIAPDDGIVVAWIRDVDYNGARGTARPAKTASWAGRKYTIIYLVSVVFGDHPDVLPPPEARTRKYKSARPDRLYRVASLRLNLWVLQRTVPSLTCSWYLLAPATSFQSNSALREPPRSGKVRTTLGAFGAARDAGVGVAVGSGVWVGVAVAVGLGGSDVGIGGAGVGVVVGPGGCRRTRSGGGRWRRGWDQSWRWGGACVLETALALGFW